MKHYYNLFLVALAIIFSTAVNAQTAINTSFESSESYNAGTINNQNKWKVTTGTSEITTDVDYVKTGTQGLKISSTSTAVQTEFIPYATAEVGLKADVYVDFYVKLKSLPAASYSITGFDLESSSHRSFMMDFLTTGKIKLYDGSSGWATTPDYALNAWTRITIKIDNNAGKYQVALDGVVLNKIFTFREIRNSATVFEFNSIRFSMGSGASDMAVEDMYIGNTPVAGISFTESSTDRTITVTQPAFGTITLDPVKIKYQLNDVVTASITVPSHYLFSAWTGSLSGSTTPATFTVGANMTIGATVIVDPANPPASSSITINQPALGGTISISPVQTTYYNGTTITATLNLQSGYSFDGWTGSLGGTTTPTTFVLSENVTIGATLTEIPYSSTVRVVTNATNFKTAVKTDMNPGDTVLVSDGTYVLSGVSITRGGTSAKPIVIKSKNLHGAKITGSSSFTLSQISYVTFEGFDIDVSPSSTIFKMEGCQYVRITRNKLKMSTLTTDQTSKWITIGDGWENAVCNSHHNRIDHNLFDGKYDGGAWLVIDGSHGTTTDISKYDRIDHNIFRNNGPRATNEKETIRVGMSDLSMRDAYCTVENNLFEDCDGDPEIISVKSGSNIIRNNTFRRCLGTLSLRHGNNTLIEGNYFFGEGKTAMFEGSTIGCGGVRVYGKGHSIINNYMEGLTGSKWDAACTITNGDVLNNSSSWSSHYVPENLVFAYNTLVDNKSNIEIGFTNNSAYNKAPINCVIANNIVNSSTNNIIYSFSTTSLAGVSFSNNIMYPSGTAALGLTGTVDAQIKQIDPLIVKSYCRANGLNCNFTTPESVYKLTQSSPAINTSVGYQTVLTDFEGQLTVGIRDIGADEYNGTDAVVNGPWSESQVGPTAPETYVYEVYTLTAGSTIIDNSIKAFPNPFTGKTVITLPVATDGLYAYTLYNSTGQIIEHKMLNTQSSEKQLKINTANKGILVCVLESSAKKYIIKLVSK